MAQKYPDKINYFSRLYKRAYFVTKRCCLNNERIKNSNYPKRSEVIQTVKYFFFTAKLVKFKQSPQRSRKLS
jgi:hypothetical protein